MEKKNKAEVQLILKSNAVNWEEVVKVSTSHYVFPALYCNYKRAKFLKYLPTDLVDYMKYITDLNRNRNKKIIEQAKKLNCLLLNNDIRPIFLKGTANLLLGLYEDIAERMLGDIDFLFSENDFVKAINILNNDNYRIHENQLDYFKGFRHHSRMIKNHNIAAVEIHKEVIIEKYRDEFSCEMIKNNTQIINEYSFPSFENQLSISIISSQINDYGFELKNFPLRNAYDVFLLSKKVDAKMAISKFNNLRIPLNCFLANCNLFFGDLETLEYFKTKETVKYLKAFKKFGNKRKSNFKTNIKLLIINFRRRLVIVFKSIFNSENRKWILKRIKRKIRI